MRSGPDVALMAAMIADPARANMLIALMSGMSLTAGELAAEAGVAASTASFHLGKLQAAGLISVREQGRRRYFVLSGPDVAGLVEALMTASSARGPQRARPGPKDLALRRARVCYDHLAGELGVLMFDRLLDAGGFRVTAQGLEVTGAGAERVERLGVDLAALRLRPRPLCRTCLDWSERRDHLSGALGDALLQRLLSLGWARRDTGSRAVRFSRPGEAKLHAWLGAPG